MRTDSCETLRCLDSSLALNQNFSAVSVCEDIVATNMKPVQWTARKLKMKKRVMTPNPSMAIPEDEGEIGIL